MFLYIYMCVCVCPPMLADALLVPLIYFGGLFTTICVSDCIKCRNNYVLTQLNKKIQ